MPANTTLKLNPAQKKAVQHKSGPLLIIAGAGTGKTKVITERIIWLVGQKIAKPSEILALTFTHKAAQEMEERVDIGMPYGYEEIWISTFHSFCDRVLRQDGLYNGLDPNYILMTQAQEYVYFRGKLHNLSLRRFKPLGNPTKFVEAILKHFSRLSDEDISPADYAKFVKTAAKSKKIDAEDIADYKELATVYEEYSEMKKNDSRVSFGDLVWLTLKLFRERPEVFRRYQDQFKYILVDEFQDTNYAQNELVKLLAGKKGNVTVVGDDDQAIYKFRGAAISNILEFKEAYPKYSKVVLTTNYRSTQEILDLSYKLIRQNDPYRLEVTEKIDKRLKNPSSDAVTKSDTKAVATPSAQKELPMSEFQKCSGGQCVARMHSRTESEEADRIADEVVRLVEEENYSLRDIAVLVRANDHSESVIQSFRHRGIRFAFPGPKGLYNRPEIKDLIAYLSLINDYGDDISAYRVLTTKSSPLSTREFIEIQRLAKTKRMKVFNILESFVGKKIGETSGEIDEGVSKLKDTILSTKSQEWLATLMDVVEKGFKQIKEGRSVGEVLYAYVVDSGYLDAHLKAKTEDDEWRVKNISKFFNLLKRFEKETEEPTVRQFMDYLEYSKEIGEDPQAENDDFDERDAVKIMTVHGAKGLEFPVVFMPCLVEQRFPTRRRSDTIPIPEDLIKEKLPEGDEHVQEERRLFYVGMTRAKKKLYLTSADFYGEGKRKKKQSVLLKDLDLIMESAEGKLAETAEEIAGQMKKSVAETDIPEVPEGLGQSFLQNLSRNLSYSQVESFNRCPYRFYFNHFLTIPSPDAASRSFGMTIHNTMKEFYDRVMRFRQGFKEIRKMPGLNDLLEIYEKKWQPEGYENMRQERERFKSGEKALTGYFKKFFDGNENPIWLEGKFRAKLGDIILKGTVDRLDQNKDGYEIIDYKTGTTIKDLKKGDDSLQLALYSIAVKESKGIDVSKASLIYVETQDKLTVEVTDTLKERARESVLKTFEQIKSLKFPAKPSGLCRFCDYRGICDYAGE